MSRLGISAGGALSVHPGYIAGNWYHSAPGAIVAAGTAFAASTIYALPFVLTKPIRIAALGARVTTASAGGNFQLAIYANNPATGRPTGAALVSTGNISTASAATASANVTAEATLAPGIYWMAVNQDNAAAAYQTLANTVPYTTALIGSTTLANVSSAAASVLMVLSVAQAFGTWPDLSAASFTEITAAPRCPLVFLKAA